MTGLSTPTPTPTHTATPTSEGHWVTVLADGFEGDWPGPWQQYGDPTWDRTNCRSFAGALGIDGGHSVWPAGTGMGGLTPCVDDYPNDLHSWLIYGPFDLSDATAAEVRFRRWQRTENDYDFYRWKASVDDAQNFGLRSSRDTSDWVPVTFDLTDVYTLGNLSGEPRVWFAFVMQSDESTTDQGVFVDDVEIRKYTGAVPPSRGASGAVDDAGVRPAAEVRP